MIKIHLVLLSVTAISASGYAQSTVTTPRDGFLGKWTRSQMAVGGKQVQYLRINVDKKFTFVTTDENGTKVNQYGSWTSTTDTIRLLVSPKRAGTGFDAITLKRTNPTTIQAVKWNETVWGKGPIVFTYAGRIETK
jgi:hypothetical protein